MWARGQAWAIYGFTMAYRETGEPRFLETAEKAADIYLKRLPEDMIPYWDFDAPDIPNEPRDASAAAITASALLEMSCLVENDDEAGHYRKSAEKILEVLSSAGYQSRDKNPAFLLHATGHWPNKSEIDASIVYADYYYIEALLRLKKLREGKSIHN
jgi:unsaturated chondroitin disaccharide hydrolase